MSSYLRYWSLLPVAMILYGCASMSSPVSPSPATESTINEKIDHLVVQLTQDMSLFEGKMFAVAELTDASDKKTALTAYLTDLLIDRLSRSGKIHLVERSRLDTVMNELDFSMTGYIEERSEKLLGRLIGADGIVTGKVIDLGDTLDVKVRLIQTETGKIISVAQVELANDRKMQRLSVQAYEKPKTDTRDKIQGLDQLKQASELVDKEDWQGLQKLAEPWTVSEPGNSYAWFNLGYAYKKLKQYDRAVRASQEALRIEPNDPWTWGNLGQAYNNLNQYDKAVTAYQEAVRIKPDYADAWYNLGLVYRDLKQYDKAVATLQEAVRIDPKDAAGWYALGDAYHDLKQYDKAVTAFQEAVRIKPEYADAWNNLGLVFYQDIEQYDKAVTAFQEVVRIKPEYADAWNNLGHVYRELKQYDKAVTAFQYALRFEPDYVLSWYSLGVVYLNQGRSGKAYKAYQTLRKLDASMADTFSNAVLKERWLRYATSDGGSVYFIDFRSISPVSESIVKVWAKIDINKNDKDFLKMREALREKGSLENAMDYVEINCVESKIRFLSTMWYDKEGILDRSEVAPISWTDG